LAGESAGDYAQRLREKAARLERSAENWERGALGERTTAEALDELTARGWTTFHDVRWPGRQRANIDHIAVGPPGVFVIDSKNWSGDVRVVDGVLWQDGRRREREVAAAAEAAIAVTGLLQGLAATPVLCFVVDEPLEGWAGDVLVCSPHNLASRLTALPPMLGPASTGRANKILEGRLTPAGRATSQRRRVDRTELAHRPTTRRSRTRRRTSRASLRRTKVTTLIRGLVLAVAVAVGATVLLPKLAAHTPELLGLRPVRAELGQSVDLHGSSARPTMGLTASTPIVLPRQRAGTTIGAGQRLVGVRVQVSNESAMSWTSPRLVVTARDSAGDSLPRVDLRAGKRRPALPAVIQLRPGSSVDGYVAFALPPRARFTDFALTLGPSSYETVWWSRPDR
jgi:hypothetical protein